MFDDELLDVYYCVKYWKGYINKYMRWVIYFILENLVVNRMLNFCYYRLSYFFGFDNFYDLFNF